MQFYGISCMHPHKQSGRWKVYAVIDQTVYRGADKSLARPGRKQARKHVTDARFQQHRDASCHQVFFFVSGKAMGPKEIHAILTETLACFLPGVAKYLSAPLSYSLLYT